MRYYSVVAITSAHWWEHKQETKGDQSLFSFVFFPFLAWVASSIVYKVEGLQPTGLVEAYAYTNAQFYTSLGKADLSCYT